MSWLGAQLPRMAAASLAHRSGARRDSARAAGGTEGCWGGHRLRQGSSSHPVLSFGGDGWIGVGVRGPGGLTINKKQQQ